VRTLIATGGLKDFIEAVVFERGVGCTISFDPPLIIARRERERRRWILRPIRAGIFEVDAGVKLYVTPTALCVTPDLRESDCYEVVEVGGRQLPAHIVYFAVIELVMRTALEKFFGMQDV
jgi:hypothetical protein